MTQTVCIGGREIISLPFPLLASIQLTVELAGGLSSQAYSLAYRFPVRFRVHSAESMASWPTLRSEVHADCRCPAGFEHLDIHLQVLAENNSALSRYSACNRSIRMVYTNRANRIVLRSPAVTRLKGYQMKIRIHDYRTAFYEYLRTVSEYPCSMRKRAGKAGLLRTVYGQ